MAFRFALAGREVGNKTNGQTVCIMQNDLFQLLQNGASPHITIQITGEEMLALFRMLREEEKTNLEQGEGMNEFLTKKEVMALLGVCDTTLWLWAKNNYLKPVKAGRKVLYRKSDVQRFLNAREDRV